VSPAARRAWWILSIAAGIACRAAPAPSSAPMPSQTPAPIPNNPPTSRLAFESSPVEVESHFGVSGSKNVRLIGDLAPVAKPAIVGGQGSEVAASLLPADGGHAAAGIRLTLSGKRAGRGVGHVVVATGLPDPKELVLYYGWKVPGNLTVSPSNPYFNLRMPGPHVLKISVGSGRSDFRLQRAEVTAGPFAARVEPAAAGGPYTVQVRVVEAGVAGGQRGFLGELVLVSNDPAEPRKEVPLFAMGASSSPSPTDP